MRKEKNVFVLFILTAFLFSFSSEVWAYSIVVSEKIRGEYQRGSFRSNSDFYQYSFDINERTRKVYRTGIRRLLDNSLDAKVVEYDILSIEKRVNEGSSERVIIFGKDFLGFYRETYVLGETFFEYCKVSSDKFLLSSGDVSVSVALRKSV